MAQILVIDDQAEMRELLDETLKRAGHETVLAANGPEGLVLLREQPIQLVITDLYMPEKEGLETIKEVRRHHPKVGIIAITGKPGAGSLLTIAGHFGAARILQKPFLQSEILAAVEDVVCSMSRN